MAYLWLVWVLLAAVFLVGEVMTPGFFLLWFAVGALVAGLLAASGWGGIAAQLIVFLGVSLALLAGSRTIFERFLNRRREGTPHLTGVETMIGQTGTVVEPSQGALHEGAVKVYGAVWTAYPVEGEAPLTEGDLVEVDRLEGNSIYVRRTARRQPLF
jgi:membrane protein implicated in regulation of membrane protease activity